MDKTNIKNIIKTHFNINSSRIMTVLLLDFIFIFFSLMIIKKETEYITNPINDISLLFVTLITFFYGFITKMMKKRCILPAVVQEKI